MPALTLVRPAGEPVHVSAYVVGVPVDVYGNDEDVPAHTGAIAPGEIDGIAFTVMLTGIPALEPQPFVPVIVPVYTPAGVTDETGMGIGLAGNTAEDTLVSPAGEPVHVRLYNKGVPVDVYGKEDAVPAHTVAIVPGVMVGPGLMVRLIVLAELVPQALVTVTVPV